MERISPVSQATCSPYIGRRVCAVLHDGSHVVGTIDSVTERGIVFRQAPGVQILSAKSAKAAKAMGGVRKKAKTSAFGYGYGFGFGTFLLEWALIALLFAFPFFYF